MVLGGIWVREAVDCLSGRSAAAFSLKVNVAEEMMMMMMMIMMMTMMMMMMMMMQTHNPGIHYYDFVF